MSSLETQECSATTLNKQNTRLDVLKFPQVATPHLANTVDDVVLTHAKWTQWTPEEWISAARHLAVSLLPYYVAMPHQVPTELLDMPGARSSCTSLRVRSRTS